ncbi:hypothetical protein Tco_0867369 [Tanacetum coccineum]
MSTPMFVDPESSTQADGAQISRVPVPLPEDPYEAIRQAYLDGTNTEFEPFEDPIDTETPETARMAVRIPHAMSSGLSSDMAEVAAMSESSVPRGVGFSLKSGLPICVYHQTFLRGSVSWPRVLLAEEEDFLLRLMKGLGLEEEEEEVVPGGQQQASSVVGTTRSVPLGLWYGALRRHELALEEGDVYSTFEVGQGSGPAQESEILERVSAFRQPTLTTWTDPKNGMIYIDIPDYPPHVQTPPSPEWTSGLLLISPSHSDIPSPISSPMIPLTVPSPVATHATAETKGFLTELGAQVEMQEGLISDHAVRLKELSPALFEKYDRDIGELFTRAIWRPVLALEAWASQTDAQRAALWHVISDV